MTHMNNDSTPASNETKLGLLTYTQLNIQEAYCLEKTWKFLLQHIEEKIDTVLINQSHKEGFKDLYDWAGQFRRTSPLVGQIEVPAPHRISELLKQLFDDLNYKIDNLDQSDLDNIIDLIAWFEYKFIWIHPFVNTNGRMGRLISNFILVKLGYPPIKFANRSDDRHKYISAMRKADNKDFLELQNFIAQELDQAINLRFH